MMGKSYFGNFGHNLHRNRSLAKKKKKDVINF